MEQVDILLATFNGVRYIDQLLDSISSQSYANWRLLVRDDCSTDDTIYKVRSFAARHNGKVTIIDNNNLRLGIIGNFTALLSESSAEYIMFADQDDIWLPRKIEMTLFKAKMLGGDTDIPLLVHTDLRVVDKNLNTIAESFWEYQGLSPNRGATLKDAMVQNVVTGCTTLINRSLAELATPIPGDAKMHDWWIAIVAAAFGKVHHIPQATILYRQHGGNDTGAKRWNLYNAVKYVFPGNKLHQNILDTEIQALAFLNQYCHVLSKPQMAILKQFALLNENNFLVRRITSFRLGLRKHKLLRTIGLYLFM
jgi:glycosyltransferase involved in cell wall biosynthesis